MRPDFYTLPKFLLLCLLSAFIEKAGAQYCVPPYENLCTSDDYINNFTLNSLSNNGSGCNGNTNNYINYDPAGTLTTELELGSAYSAVMQSGATPYAQGFGIWIDYNNDEDFDDADEFVYASPFASTGQFTTTITMPSEASYAGVRRMRVRCRYNTVITSGESCAQFSYGETEDYTVTISAATTSMSYVSSTVTQTNFNALGLGELDAEIIGIQVMTIGALNPLDVSSLTLNSNGCSNFASDVDAVKIYYTGGSPVFSADQLYAIVSDLSAPVIVNATLSPGPNYFWVGYDIAPNASIGDALDAECTQIVMTGSGGTKVPAITAPPGFREINYCFPTYTNLCTSNDFIDNVTLNTLSNVGTGCNGNLNNYIYYPPSGNLTTSLELSSNYTITLQSGQEWDQGIGVWIDFNNDLDFNDADEFVYVTPNYGTELFVGNISVPNNAAYLGDHRMRIRCMYNYVPFAGDYCNNQQYGETEDYTITVTPSTTMQLLSVS
ncbi:MAG TPA: GEVED domain-containing protein, partial [Chitinophagales bacterium]|nr:GEVED domain-containing protein [Chitinophagales bacterium]